MLACSNVSEDINFNYQHYVDKIKNEISKAADNWLHIAYYVYEMNYFKYYSPRFSNIVECCLVEFGFKKSTTYNFIRIVEQCSRETKSTVKNYVSYVDFFKYVKGWSYSQLVSMLSLSSSELSLVTPDMSSRQIKMLKSDSKRLENATLDDSDISKRLENSKDDILYLKRVAHEERTRADRLSSELEILKSENQELKRQIEELTCIISYMHS